MLLSKIKSTYINTSDESWATFYFEISTIQGVFAFSLEGFSLFFFTNFSASLFGFTMGVSVDVAEVK